MSSLQDYLLQQQMMREEAAEAVQDTPVVEPEVQPQQPAPEPTDERSVRQVADATQKEQLDRGVSTQVGEFIQAADPRNLANNLAAGLNALVPEGAGVLKDATQAVDDFVMSQQELKDQSLQTISSANERGDIVSREVLATGQGVASGLEAAVALPFTIAARLENADSSAWSEPPAELKESATGELAFEITRIVAPTLLGLGSASLVTRAAVESAVETIPQRGAEDLILGREGAIKAGEIAEFLGYDGKQLTQDLIEGKKPSAQLANAVAGYLQNFGINIGAEVLFGRIGRLLNRGSVDESVEQVARITGKSADDVAASLDNVSLPNKGKDYDINEAITLDTGVPEPDAGNELINSDAFLLSSVRRTPTPKVDVPTFNADNSYFTNLARFTDNASYRQALDEATKALDKLPPGSVERDQVLVSAQAWVKEFLDESGSRLDVDRALDAFPYELNEPLKPTAEFFEDVAERGLNEKEFLTNEAITTPEGAVVSTIIGEEMGMRLHHSAHTINNIDNLGVEWTAAVERYLELQQKTQLFMVPLRRFQRRFHIGGEVLQKDNVKKVVSGRSIRDAKGVGRDLSTTAPARDFQLIRKTPEDEGRTIKELLDAYKGGDTDAANTLKTYFSVLSHSSPKTAIASMDNLQDVLINELKRGNKDATRQLLYAGFLTRLAPQTASLASNFANLIKEPLGLALSGEGRYAAGQVVGAFSVMNDALRAGKKAFKNGYSVNAGSKLDGGIKESAAEHARLEQLWEGVQKELNANGASSKERALAWWDYTRQRIAANPINSFAGRLFTGADEWSKVIYGGMTATGKAFREAGEAGVKRGTDEFKDIVQRNFNEQFIGGVKTGQLNPDTGVLRAANEITFSNPIPRDGNFVDKAFRAVQDAGETSSFWNFVSPFTRVSYWTMEKGGVMMASSLPLPKGVKENLLGRVIPRYRATLNGEMGELAQLQLKSNIAFAHYTSMMVGGAAWMGFTTGRNPQEGLPEMSFIIPTDNDKGYVAVPYGRLEPFATYISMISDATQSFRDNVITEQDYNQFITDTLQAAGLATFDKSFMTGMGNIADLFDVNNFSPSGVVRGANTLSSVATSALLPVGGYAALTRMVSEWTNPYQTLGKADPNENLFGAITSAIAQRNFGGHTNPIRYNPLNGEPEMKAGALKGKDRWLGFLQLAGNEALMPGKVRRGADRDIYDVFEATGYETKRLYNGVRTADGIPLSLQQQSILLQDLHTYGGLQDRLRDTFKDKNFKRLLADIKRSRKDNTQEGRFRTERLEQQAQAAISKAYADAKARAVSVGRLSKDEGFLTSRLAQNNSRRPQQMAEGVSMEKRLNPALQNILDFPVK